MKICGKCGAEMREGQEYCYKCGTSTKITPSNNYSSTNIKFCIKCGTQLTGDALFCPKCGARQSGQSNVGYSQNNYNDRNYNSGYQGNQPIFKGGQIGFILTFFLSIVGLILCYALGDEDCKAAAKKTFIICLIVGVIIGVIYGIIIANAIDNANDYYYYYTYFLNLLKR